MRVPFLMPGLEVSQRLFALTSDGRCLYAGGHWDNSLLCLGISRGGVAGGGANGRIEQRLVAHSDVVTCVVLDAGQNHLMTGSRDTTCVVWDLATGSPMQWLYGHSSAVSCVALSMELDLAVSGGRDGTVNLHTVHKGQFMHSLQPAPPSVVHPTSVSIEHLLINALGSVYIHGECLDSGRSFLSAFSINGRRLDRAECWLPSRVTAMALGGEHLLCGCQSGELLILESADFAEAKSPMPFGHAITDVHLVQGLSHALLALSDGKLIIINGLKPSER